MVLPRVSEQFYHLIASAGWSILPVKPIYAPAPPAFQRWKEMFTKLLMWNYTEYDKIVYLDSDTLVLQNFDEIFYSPAEFSAVGDIDFETKSFLTTFNAGVFVLSPNQDSFNKIMNDIHLTNRYNSLQAEQSFLNWWYEYKWLHLPYKYNANLQAYLHRRSEWDKFGVIKIIHYTYPKPFVDVSPDAVNMESILQLYFEVYRRMKTVACD